MPSMQKTLVLLFGKVPQSNIKVRPVIRADSFSRNRKSNEIISESRKGNVPEEPERILAVWHFR
jgi:hypothetical protein